MDVGVRQLKQQLSAYLDRAAAGEVITVTERGRPKARIVPITDQGALASGIEQGWIRPPTSDRPVGRAQRHLTSRRTADALDEDRGR